ncbi:MAG: hypothetical protein IRZ16_04575 [Myxococcaceae bacterium]|nr:hypothetical protein [Myxococcaceae bacterium]
MSVVISAAAALFFSACGGSEAVPTRTGTTTQALTDDDCTILRETINKLREEVKSCNPAGTMNQCNLVLEDVCCPISASGGPVQEFKDAVAKYKDQCNYACTAVMCQDPSQGKCGLDGQCHP